jgi:hypothetical protein
MTKATSVVLSMTIFDGETPGEQVDITQYVDDIGEFQRNITEEEVTPFGTDEREYESQGVKGYEPFTFSGYLSDDEDNPAVLLDGAEGEHREMVITWLSGDTVTVDALIVSVNRIPQQRNLTRYSVTVRPQAPAAAS